MTPEHPHHRHNLLKDDDDELLYLVQHLSRVHKAFYEEYDSALVDAQGGRVAQLKHGHVKKVSMKDDAADLRVVPDVAHVMPSLKYVPSMQQCKIYFLHISRRQVLDGTTIVMSGLVPLSTDLMRYIFPPFTQYLNHDIHNQILIEYFNTLDTNMIERYRSEIALQASSFGAQLQTR